MSAGLQCDLKRAMTRCLAETCHGLVKAGLIVATARAGGEPTTTEIMDGIQAVAEMAKDGVRQGLAQEMRAELSRIAAGDANA